MKITLKSNENLHDKLAVIENNMKNIQMSKLNTVKYVRVGDMLLVNTDNSSVSVASNIIESNANTNSRIAKFRKRYGTT